jgi:hypothetical protein
METGNNNNNNNNNNRVMLFIAKSYLMNHEQPYIYIYIYEYNNNNNNEKREENEKEEPYISPPYKQPIPFFQNLVKTKAKET